MKKILCSFFLSIILLINTSVFATETGVNFDLAVKNSCDPQKMQIELNAKSEYGFKSGAKMSVLVYPEDAASPDTIIYANSVVFGNDKTYKFQHAFAETDPTVRYVVKLTYSKDVDNNVEYTYVWKHIPTADVENMLSRFKNLNAEAFEQAYIEATNGEYVTASEIAGVTPVDTLGEHFVFARSAFEKGLFSNDWSVMLDFKDVEDCLKAAVVVREMKVGDSTSLKNVLNTNASSMNKLFEQNTNYEKFVKYFVISNYETEESLTKAIKLAIALSKMEGGSYAVIEAALAKYYDALDIDLEYLEDNDVTLAEISKKIDKKIPSSYKDGLKEEIPKFVSAILEGRQTPGGGSSGGSGGGSMGGVSKGDLYSDYIMHEIANGSSNEEIYTPTANKNAIFKDMAGYEWAQNSIEYLYKKGVVNGVDNENYEPARYVTREEFLKMLVNAFNVKPDVSKAMTTFSDLPLEHWAYPYIEAAYTSNISSGMGGYFGIGENITRQDAAVMCNNIIRRKGLVVSPDEAIAFSDSASLSEYAQYAIEVMSSKKIINGYPDGSFMPTSGTTRAEAAVIIERLIKFFEEVGA